MKAVRRFPMATSLLCSLILVHLCSLACSAAAAPSPEQEIEAEAKKLLPTLFTRCGEDYFSKRTFHYRSGSAYVIGQYKELILPESAPAIVPWLCEVIRN